MYTWLPKIFIDNFFYCKDLKRKLKKKVDSDTNLTDNTFVHLPRVEGAKRSAF